MPCDDSDFLRGFNKSYNNTALRFGVIKKIYPANDPRNISRLSTEYDVEVIEQDTNKGIAPITYKHCLSVDSLGGIADFFEKNFRAQTQSKNFQLPITKGQNGATVLVLCLDATTGKGIILGGLNHPDRKTTLKDDHPHLEGEYNGVNIKVEYNGAPTLTFNGATNSDGTSANSGRQGRTVVSIDETGSFYVDATNSFLKSESAFKVGSDGVVRLGSVSNKAEVKIIGPKGAQLSVGDAGDGKIAFGAQGIEVLDLLDKTLKKQSEILDAIKALTVGTLFGPSSVPINAAKFVALQKDINDVDADLNKIKGTIS